MKTIYVVPWIEVRYGWSSLPKGYKIYDYLDECISSTKENELSGLHQNGYYGPERPLHYYEVEETDNVLFPLFVDKYEFKTEPILIK